MSFCCRLLSKQAKLFCLFPKANLKQENGPNGCSSWHWTLHGLNNNLCYTASNNEMSQYSWSAKDVQVRDVACTDLLPNLWLEALSTNNKNLRHCITCLGDDFRTSVAGTYQKLPTQTTCSVQRPMKIITIIVSILIIIPTEPRWPARDTVAQKRSMLCKNIIP